MDDYYNFRNSFVFSALFFALVVVAVLILTGMKNHALSYSAGTAAGILNFMLMSRGIARMAQSTDRKNLFTNAAFRFSLLLLLIVLFINKSWFKSITFFCGLFTMQGIIFFKVFSGKTITGKS